MRSRQSLIRFPPPPKAEKIDIEIPAAFTSLFQPCRYKIFYGGRGAGKSENFGRALLCIAHTQRKLILCTRQYQSSIADSVHRVLRSQISELDLDNEFEVRLNTITSRATGSQFIFKGLQHNITEIKSLEGVDICWVEEGQSLSEDSWLVLDPTIRRTGSEIWVSMNPELVSDASYRRFIVAPPSNALVRKVTYRNNPWFPPALELQRRQMMARDPDAYEWVWEGNCRRISAAVIFQHHVTVEAFETPEVVDRFFYGADWGFANDPTVLIRCYIAHDILYIDYEAYAVGVEIDDTPALFDGGRAAKSGIEYPGIPGARDWPIKADSARPETISYMARRGFNIAPAAKWQGSLEDGIAHLKGFRRIVIHERCVNTATESRLYSYKVDRNGDILPVIVDQHNHCFDAIRYSLDGYIQARGGLAVWERLAS